MWDGQSWGCQFIDRQMSLDKKEKSTEIIRWKPHDTWPRGMYLPEVITSFYVGRCSAGHRSCLLSNKQKVYLDFDGYNKLFQLICRGHVFPDLTEEIRQIILSPLILSHSFNGPVCVSFKSRSRRGSLNVKV